MSGASKRSLVSGPHFPQGVFFVAVVEAHVRPKCPILGGGESGRGGSCIFCFG